MNTNLVLRAEQLTKELRAGEIVVQALRGVSLDVERGELLGIIGPSGSGKSTLLGLIGGLDSPTSGRIEIDGVDITNLNERALTRVRNEKIGFVFQFFNLIPTLSALENVALPIQFANKRRFNPNQRAKELLTTLGLSDRLHNRPTQLSGGQQQRVAIARALANSPALLLCDEPTGSLDSESSAVVMQALKDVQRQMGTTVIVVTHNMEIAAQMDRLVTLVDGHITSDVEGDESVEMAALKLFKQKRLTGEMSAVKA
ncbi:MAG TPA: ABC transporter ATP-binding protein [Aggregatilineales bacterium]|nr:ABC transporter ATP-binding protein [Aggregatilineales bacterium]